MKLVELLARELSEWHEDTAYVFQDQSGTIYCTSKGKPKYKASWQEWNVSPSSIEMSANDSIYGVTLDVASDHAESVINRAQWQAERDRQKGGEWNRHRGGKQPVENRVRVECKLRCGDIQQGASDDFLWPHAYCDVAANIMQYRVISHPQAEEVEVKDTTIGTLSYKVEIDTSAATQAIDELAAKWDQVDGPLRWRDCVNELDAYIEEFTRERDELINRLAEEGFALIGKINKNLDKIDATLDMTDWRNWKVGDIIRKETSKHPSMMGVGDEGEITMIDNHHPTNPIHIGPFYVPHVADLKFIRRP